MAELVDQAAALASSERTLQRELEDRSKLLEEVQSAQAESLRRLEAMAAELNEVKDWAERQVELVRAEEHRLCDGRVSDAQQHERLFARQQLQDLQRVERQRCDEQVKQVRDEERAQCAQELGKIQSEMQVLREEVEREVACAHEDLSRRLCQAERALEEKEDEMRNVEAQVQAWAENEIHENKSRERQACERRFEAERERDRLRYKDEVGAAKSLLIAQ